MDEKKKVIIETEYFVFIFIVLCMFVGMTLSFTWQSSAQVYNSSEDIICYDANDNPIKGLVCYEEITCSTKLKLFNDDRCKKLLMNETLIEDG